MKNDTLLLSLFLLISYDFATTFIGVLYMGATEINPLYIYFGSIRYWFIFKFAIGIFCLATLAYIDNDRNVKVIQYGLMGLNIVYLTVAINNTIQIGMNL